MILLFHKNHTKEEAFKQLFTEMYPRLVRYATQADVESNYKEHEALLQKAEDIAHRLPEPTCTVLRLCYYERLTYREAALRLGISPDTVKKHISKALRILREAMNK